MITRSRRALTIAALVTTFDVTAAHAEEPATPPASSTASAQVDPAAEARQQYDIGTQAYAAKRFVEAALHFEAAAAQRAHAVTLYTAALAWDQANRPERAADDFGRALDVPGLSPQQTANARERLSTLEKSLGTLEVTGPEGVRVQLDGLTEVATPARLHATPGAHVLVMHAPQKPIVKRDVTLDLAQVTRISLRDEPESAPVSPSLAKTPEAAVTPAPIASQEMPATLDVRRTIGVTLIGVGGAILLSGVVLGLNANGARDAYDAGPTRAAFDHATSLQTWTNVAFVTGGVLAAGGIALVVWPSPRGHAIGGKTAESARLEPVLRVAPSLGGAVVQGAF